MYTFFSHFRLDFPNYALAVAFFLNTVLAVVIYTNGRRKKEELSFGLLASSVALWALGMFLYRGILDNDSAVFWTKIYYVFAGIIPSTFFYFALNYPVRQAGLGRGIKILISVFSLVSIASPLFGTFIVKNVIAESITENQIFFGPGLLAWGFYTIIYFGFAFYFLFRQYIHTKENTLKQQYKFIIIGSMASVLIGFTTNHVLPLFFGNPSLAWVGPTASLIMTSFIVLAMFKHNLFNVKLVITEILIFFVWATLIVNLLLSQSAQTFIPNVIVFIIVIILGIFVIRSVVYEVVQRERIEKLAADLEKVNVRLTELDRQKSEFVSFATHQLRAPLTAMKGYASLLLEGDMGVLPAEARKGVDRIFESTNTLVHIVDDYLNISRIELGSMKYAFDTIDLKALVEDVVGEMRPTINKSGIKFSFKAENAGIEYRITADKDKLKQVLVNVIDNSLKYTPCGSISVTLSFDRARHLFVFAVKDTGVGISPETLPRLFQKFTRAENANKTNIRGTGLGLYVAKQIVEAHHGTIKAESPGEGKGATFSVELDPFSKA